MFKKVLFFFLLGVFPLLTSAQAQSLPDDETHRHFKKEAVGGLVVHQNGWGAIFRRGTHLTGYKKRMFEIEAVSLTNPKEYDVVNPAYANPFSYGKLNSVLDLRTGIGIQKVLYSKADRSGVEVKYCYYGGFSWAIAKPVYLDVLHPTSIASNPDIVSEKYNPERHTFVDSIYGKSSFSSGLGDMKLYPGLYGKLGLNFEYGADDDVVKAVEAGIVVDYFPRAIPIMAYIPNNNIYFSFYISFMYGGRW